MKKLIREADNLIREGQIEFVKFNKFNRAKEVITHPEIGWHCIVDRTETGFSWLSSEIVEVTDNNNFKTIHSNYKIETNE